LNHTSDIFFQACTTFQATHHARSSVGGILAALRLCARSPPAATHCHRPAPRPGARPPTAAPAACRPAGSAAAPSGSRSPPPRACAVRRSTATTPPQSRCCSEKHTVSAIPVWKNAAQRFMGTSPSTCDQVLAERRHPPRRPVRRPRPAALRRCCDVLPWSSCGVIQLIRRGLF